MFRITENISIPKIYVLYFMFGVIIVLLFLLFRQHQEQNHFSNSTNTEKIKYILTRDSMQAVAKSDSVHLVEHLSTIQQEAVETADSVTSHIDSIEIPVVTVEKDRQEDWHSPERFKKYFDSTQKLKQELDSINRLLTFYRNRYPHLNITSDTTTRYDINLRIDKRYESKKFLGVKLPLLKKKYLDVRSGDDRVSVMGDSVYTIKLH